MNDEDEAFTTELMKTLGQRGEHALDEGRVLINVHHPASCEGRGCSIHHPSDHKMKNWPKDFRGPDTDPTNWGYMERYCQHRVPHPDPDDIRYWLNYRDRDISAHRCDGCCGATP